MKKYYLSYDDFDFLDCEEFYRFEGTKYAIDEESFVKNYCTDEEIKDYVNLKISNFELSEHELDEYSKCRNKMDYWNFLLDGITEGELLDRWCHINVCLYLKKNKKRIFDKKYI